MRVFFFIVLLVVLAPVRGVSETTRELNQWRTTFNRLVKKSHLPIYTAQTVARFPQKRPVYVQGMYLDKSDLYTSSGQYHRSFLRHSVVSTGAIRHQKRMPSPLFAEGITVYHHRLYQLFWHAKKGMIYSLPKLKQIGSFRYRGQGWGLTHDRVHLIMSNGSSTLLFLNPQRHFRVEKTREVRAPWGPLRFLNALYYRNGIVYANLWYVDMIAMISVKTGRVVGWIDVSTLQPRQPTLSSDFEAINGIAFNAKTKHLIVTGKCWHYVYEIQLSPARVNELTG